MKGADGDVEVAVSKVGDHSGGREWSDATARFVFGFIPFVGGMGVQAEAVWIQIRTVAVIAALYGHDVDAEEVQQAIIVCLMDGAATQVSDGSAQRQMERVAMQQVIRKLVISLSGAGAFQGLFNGITGALKGSWDGARPPPALIERCKLHFAPRRLRAETTHVIRVGALALIFGTCKLITPTIKILELPEKLIKPRARLDALPWLRPCICLGAVAFALLLLVAVGKYCVRRFQRTTSTAPLLVFTGLALLQALLGMNIIEDALKACLALVPHTGLLVLPAETTSTATAATLETVKVGRRYLLALYHVHRGVYGGLSLWGAHGGGLARLAGPAANCCCQLTEMSCRAASSR